MILRLILINLNLINLKFCFKFLHTDILHISYSMATVEAYNKIAHEFSSSRHYKWPWITDFYKDYVYKTTKSLCLDVGCGNGRNIKEYQTNKCSIIGIDNSTEFINICQSQNLNCKLMDMTCLKFDDNMFDYITVIASFHHLNNTDDRNKCLCEINRVLKPNGIALISVWSKKQPSKTKRTFDNYGDVQVPWKSSKTNKIVERYYYIFKIDEIFSLFKENNFEIINHVWDCGNEIFIIKNKNKE